MRDKRTPEDVCGEARFVRDIWHKYHLGYFKIVSNFTRQTAREISYNNFDSSLVVFIPNTTLLQIMLLPVQISFLLKSWPVP